MNFNRIQSLLWVDDHPEFIRFAEEKFANKGVSVTSVLSFESAEKKIRGNAYAGYIIDLDLGLKSQSGLHLVPIIRKYDKVGPIFIISGFADDEDWISRIENVKDEISGVISKPIPAIFDPDFDELIMLIETELLKSNIKGLKEKYGKKIENIQLQEKEILNRKTCFVLMPFGNVFDEIYTDQIKPIIQNCQLNCIRGDEFYSITPIIEDIILLIQKSDIILADVTNNNPNVYYELGVAHALKKDVIIITQEITKVPFDIKHLRCIEYDYTPIGMRRFENKIEQTLNLILEKKRPLT